MAFSKYYIGTAGWSYKDWVTSFYPKQQSGKFDWLQFYSHYFNCVEVNSTYYTYLSPKIVEGWVKKVADSDDFIFHIKLHQDFTHKRKFDEQSIKAVAGASSGGPLGEQECGERSPRPARQRPAYTEIPC